MILLGKVLILLGTITLVLYLWLVTDPRTDALSPAVMVGMPLLIVSCYVVGFFARFIRMPKR
jgi:uncharacterized membrane protein HdeD (DUF308 family)